MLEAIDRRRRSDPEFWNVEFDPDSSTVRRTPADVLATMQRIGAVEYALRYQEGYPPRGQIDANAIVIDEWLRHLRNGARQTTPGTA